MIKKITLEKSFEFEIVDFLKREKTISPEAAKRKGKTVDAEWVKALLQRCAHVHWVAMGEHEKIASGKGKADLEHEGWQELAQTGMSAEAIEIAKAFSAQWTVQQRGSAHRNMHPPGGQTTLPLYDIYMAVWASWDEEGFGTFSPNINSGRYGHDHDRPDRHDYWNPAARLLLKIIEWLGYSEANVRGLIDTMHGKRKPSRRNTPPIRS
jgi:predicted RNA binding protein YcfA (HicA-like mRNA interferase family)